ncbi:hypothetical protein E8E11_009300 [Didymella keratinophila]|nr:hypothetical protein E8E11_009300 [Didymella keratinophila]
MFLSDAEKYLDAMSFIVTEEALTYEKLVKYTRELHDLRPRWAQARRRIVTTKELLMHITEHTDFTSIYGFKGRIVNESYFSKRINHLDARIARCDELEDQTKTLISLIFNLATLRDTKKTIEETAAANALAASVRRVTMLGFIYLPLTLASGVFGMNNRRHPHHCIAGRNHQQSLLDKPYLSWPSHLELEGLDVSDFKEVLRRDPGKGCQVVKYIFDVQNRQWVYEKATAVLEVLKDMIVGRKNGPSCFLMASSLQDEAIKSLGFWMGIPPNFFILPSVHLRVITGTRGNLHLMFSLQYMSKFSVGHTPTESQRAAGLPPYRFMHKHGPQNHEWHVNHARFIFFSGSGGVKSPATACQDPSDGVHMTWRGLYMFDQPDDTIATRLRGQLLAFDREYPQPTEVYQGLGQIIQDVILIISIIRTDFFDEAMVHLQALSRRCLKEDLSTEKQLSYLEDLYNLLPLWSQVRRQLDGTKNLIAQVSRHEISSLTSGERDDRYYVKRLSVIEDQLRRCNDVADKTKNLISLVMNIASLQESRAAVQESKSANATAASIKRVTILTFIYLPLTLASSILGMNITQITGEGTHSQLWLYFVIAVALIAATSGGWVLSNEALNDRLRNTIRKTELAIKTDDPEVYRIKGWSSP